MENYKRKNENLKAIEITKENLPEILKELIPSLKKIEIDFKPEKGFMIRYWRKGFACACQYAYESEILIITDDNYIYSKNKKTFLEEYEIESE